MKRPAHRTRQLRAIIPLGYPALDNWSKAIEYDSQLNRRSCGERSGSKELLLLMRICLVEEHALSFGLRDSAELAEMVHLRANLPGLDIVQIFLFQLGDLFLLLPISEQQCGADRQHDDCHSRPRHDLKDVRRRIALDPGGVEHLMVYLITQLKRATSGPYQAGQLQAILGRRALVLLHGLARVDPSVELHELAPLGAGFDIIIHELDVVLLLRLVAEK